MNKPKSINNQNMSTKRTTQQLAFILIHYWAPVIDEQNWEMQKSWLLMLDDTLKQLTPRQFEQIFPIKKQYKGREEGFKDYYTVVDWIGENIGQDNKIPNGIEFMFEYLNIDVEFAAVKAMKIIGKFHQRQAGTDLLTDFLNFRGVEAHYRNEGDES
ncbi:hypothetical protein EFO64_02475 [Limosilactobacillus reuteri]|uniref:hypothetical protein n=1 Tax=Limosilactobacillus reuteri TaxID=1598 RepID=UPI00117ED34F|nr:hypothetical protein [Limosilactobacillus reuteri]MCT3200957.1 hypothetical protein [Limosilactobacillus reuteri]MCT3202689.1 hypothetical protein [Limosilactobacillus reuteri]MCT3212607.1 hypothetical protein [Limosilactobacillus reuteri]QWS03350.1 hypothetical protein I6U32_06400 [Limosilactobacillus reuteri]TSB20934.1 hypothetical protein FOG82_00175 [Limosilactobacillus reuteri]